MLDSREHSAPVARGRSACVDTSLFDLSGRVVYHAGEHQTGVRFIYREGGGSRRLRELVRRFKTM